MAGTPLNTIPNEESAGLKFLFRALRHRNYRLFFGGQSISLIGTWMTRIATSWLVFRLTHSAMLLGLVGFAGQIPVFIFAPFAGVWVDRWNRHRVLIATQILAMLQSFALAALALTGRITAWEILWLSAFQGLINAFDMPGRQAFLVEMIEGREDLGNAIALNSSMVTMARLIGPSLAGLVIAGFGEGYCFLIDGISYIAVIISLLMMRLPQFLEKPPLVSMMAQLKEGWIYVSKFAPVRTILLLFAVISLMGMPVTVLMPIFAAQILHGGAHTLGFLMGALGAGALVGAIMLAFRKSVLGLGRVIAVSSALFGVGLIAFGLSRIEWLSMTLMVVTGFGMMQQMAASNTIIQTVVPEDMRGRTMSYYTMAFVGMAPFGSLLAGALANLASAPTTLVITGAFCVAAAGWFASQLPMIRRHIRPVYRELGILPPEVIAVMADGSGD